MIICIDRERETSFGNDALDVANNLIGAIENRTGLFITPVIRASIQSTVDKFADNKLLRDNPQPVFYGDIADIVFNKLYQSFVKHAHTLNKNLTLNTTISRDENNIPVQCYEVTFEDRPLESEPLPPLEDVLQNLPPNPFTPPPEIQQPAQPEGTQPNSPERDREGVDLPEGWIDLPVQPSIPNPSRMPQNNQTGRGNTIIIDTEEGQKDDQKDTENDSSGNNGEPDTEDTQPNEEETQPEDEETQKPSLTVDLTPLVDAINKQGELIREQQNRQTSSILEQISSWIDLVNPTPTLSNIAETLSNLGETLHDSITTPIVNVMDTIGSVLTGIGNKISEGFTFVVDTIVNQVQKTLDFYQSLSDNIISLISNAFSFNLTDMTTVICSMIETIKSMSEKCSFTKKRGA